MLGGDIKVLSQIFNQMPKEAKSDLYRAKYGMPLDGESHERYIATKVPYRKNKDYRPRFRNYSFGFPTYKKDNYTRHWYNFVDIMRNTDAPIIIYSKIYFTSYLIGMVYNSFGGWRGNYTPNNALDSHKMLTSSNYLKNTFLGQGLRELIYKTRGPSATFAVLSTFYFWVVARFRSFEYSLSQSILRATAVISPIIVFLKVDRPCANFWWRSGATFALLYPFIYTFAVNKNTLSGESTPNSEKFYLKSVSPQEIAKIEYEDQIQNYGRMFDLDNAYNYYDSYNQRTSDKYIFKSAL